MIGFCAVKPFCGNSKMAMADVRHRRDLPTPFAVLHCFPPLRNRSTLRHLPFLTVQRWGRVTARSLATIPQLQPGAYSVTVEAQGFEPQQNDNVVLGPGPKADGEFHP